MIEEQSQYIQLPKWISCCHGNFKKCTGFHLFQPLSFGNYSPFIGVEENETHSNGNSVSKVTEFTYHFREPFNALRSCVIFSLFMHIYELCCTSEWEFCIHIYCLFSCVPYKMALLTVSQWSLFLCRFLNSTITVFLKKKAT